MVKLTQCSECRRIISDKPKELGWTKIENKYLCTWCEIKKIGYTIEEEYPRIRKKRESGIYTTTFIATKPLIITKNYLKGGDENDK